MKRNYTVQYWSDPSKKDGSDHISARENSAVCIEEKCFISKHPAMRFLQDCSFPISSFKDTFRIDWDDSIIPAILRERDLTDPDLELVNTSRLDSADSEKGIEIPEDSNPTLEKFLRAKADFAARKILEYLPTAILNNKILKFRINESITNCRRGKRG
jgi:hypothetical protein